MGDAIVQCDGCGAMARRRPGRPCPGGPPSIYVVWACSAECRDKLWRSLPGRTGADLDAAREGKRPRKPGRGGIGGARIAELEQALGSLLAAITIEAGGDGGMRGAWFKGTADHCGLVEEAQRVLAGVPHG